MMLAIRKACQFKGIRGEWASTMQAEFPVWIAAARHRHRRARRSSATFDSARSDSGCDGVDELESRRSESPKCFEDDWDETDPVCERAYFFSFEVSARAAALLELIDVRFR